MPRRRSPRVLLATHWQAHPFVVGLARYAAKADWHLDLRMHVSGGIPTGWRGDGIITMLGGRRELSRFVRRARVPVVNATLNEPSIAVARVAFDNQVVGRLAAEHLLEKGFRQFAWYSYGRQVEEQLRCRAFAETVERSGHACARLVWRQQRGKRKDTWSNRQAWLKQQLIKATKPLAVFTVDDTVAVEVVEACLAGGLEIPDQVAVLGTGNLEVFRESTAVPLSSVIADLERLATEAARLLDRLMAGDKPPSDPILLPPEGIAARRSTDTIAVDHPQVAAAIRFMLDHYSEPIGVQEIVKATTMSQTRLYLAFQEQLGETLAAVLNRIRLDKAKQMLRETDDKIRVVSDACGFGDPVNLYRTFQRALGTSPQAYRVKSRNATAVPDQ